MNKPKDRPTSQQIRDFARMMWAEDKKLIRADDCKHNRMPKSNKERPHFHNKVGGCFHQNNMPSIDDNWFRSHMPMVNDTVHHTKQDYMFMLKEVCGVDQNLPAAAYEYRLVMASVEEKALAFWYMWNGWGATRIP